MYQHLLFNHCQQRQMNKFLIICLLIKICLQRNLQIAKIGNLTEQPEVKKQKLINQTKLSTKEINKIKVPDTQDSKGSQSKQAQQARQDSTTAQIDVSLPFPMTDIVLPTIVSGNADPVINQEIPLSQLMKVRTTDRGLDLSLVRPKSRRNSPGLKKVFSITEPNSINPSLLLLKNIKRNINGSKNNQIHHNFGVANTTQIRHCKFHFANDKFEPVTDRPNVREISNVVGKVRQKMHFNPNNVTMAFTIWGQFIDHDFQFTPGTTQESLNIQIPKCDSFFDSDCNGTRAIPFTRTLISNETEDIGKRLPFNAITTWMDASMVYGSSEEQATKLRKFVGGLMKTDKFFQNLLPEGPDILNTFENKTQPSMEGGDVRSNQNLILLAYQTLFLRQHNRICNLISRFQKNLSDQDLYTIAKNYVAALIQKITYDDFLPILFGQKQYNELIGPYKGYNNKINPTLQVQFTSTGYRFGHSLIVPDFPFVNFLGDILGFIKLDNALFRPDLMSNVNLDRIFRGATRTITKARDGEFVDQIRNLLVIAPQVRFIRMDLLAINLHRGRDNGVPDYNSLRECYGLKKVQKFQDISDDKLKNQQLKEVYKQLDKIDAYMGIQTQKAEGDSILGETGSVIVSKAFRNIRDGDRFWYENVFPADIIAEIKATKLSQVILRNTFITQLQQDVFHYHFGTT